MSEALVGSLALAGAGLVLLVLAWLIGVQGMVELVNNYRANPERFPDREGLGRWMALTLAGGGASFLVCAGAFAGGYVSENLFGMWTATTGIALAALAIGGIARFRRDPPANPATGPDRRPPHPRR